MADLIGSLIGGVGFGGNVIGAALVKLRLDTDEYQRQQIAAKAQTTTAANDMGSSWTKFGSIAKAGALAAGAAVVAFGANAVRAASDQGEALNKSEVIFGKHAQVMEDWAETGAEAFGLSKTASLEAAAGFGQIIQNAGLTVGASADMSRAIVKLAGDMASFNNEDPSAMLERLRSGLSGEVEPLRRFGVDLSAATVEAKGMALGLADASGELDAGAKIQARYAILMEQTTKQQNDFARTAESLPNQLRSLRAEFENVSAEVGGALLPAMQSIIGVIRNLIPLIGVVANNFGLIVGALAGFAAVRFVPDLLFKMALGLEAIKAAGLANLALDAAAAASAMGGFVTAIAAAPVAAYKLVQAIDPVDEGMIRLNERMKEFGVVRGPAMEQAAERMGAELEIMQQKAGLAAVGMLNLAGETAESRTEVDKTQQAVRNFANLTDEELKEWQTSTEASFDSFVNSLEDVTTETEVTAEDFRDAMRNMREDAHALDRAMRDIAQDAREGWVSAEFVKFIAEQGPEWLIAFAELSDKQAKKFQTMWEEGITSPLNNSTTSLDKFIERLGDIDKKESRHKVVIEYQYLNYDPDLPGMRPRAKQLG